LLLRTVVSSVGANFSQQAGPRMIHATSCDLIHHSARSSTLIENVEQSTHDCSPTSEHDQSALLAIIVSSRVDESLSNACGNSITLLIKLGHSFVGSDLSKIRCSEAAFKNADFRDVNFKGSVFRDCSWDGCCLDGCDFEDCDFTNSNLIEERSSLRDSSHSITDLLTLNKKDVVISTTSERTSIWSEGSIVNRLTEMKNCDLYSSPNEKWLLVSGRGIGYLFHSDNLKEVYLKIEDLHCVRDTIALTDDGMCYGVKSEISASSNEDFNLFHLSLPNDLKVGNIPMRSKVNTETLRNLRGLKYLDPTHLFVYGKNKLNWDTCSIHQFLLETNQFQPLFSIRMTLSRFDKIPLSPYLFCWSTNRVPFVLHFSSPTITRCEVNLPLNIRAYDCCASPDGSSMLLSSSMNGYLLLLRQESETFFTFTKHFEVPGMTGTLSPSQFSSDSQLVSLVCGSEIRVIRVESCVCLQVIALGSGLDRVSFNQHDRELLMLKRKSDKVIRRRIDLKEELHFDSSQSSPSDSEGDLMYRK
jgi:uncharacterized protein YjbI with pentapeptide repeats